MTRYRHAFRSFGVLQASTLATALIADFLLMPALVLTLKPFGEPGVSARASDEVVHHGG